MYQLHAEGDHQKLGAWFLGPKGENQAPMLAALTNIVQQHAEWRSDFFLQDPPYITDEVTSAQVYKEEWDKINKELEVLQSRLRNSIPFFSSRYKGHMNWDTSIIGSLAYFATALYNPNNVTVEASPVTTELEELVGKDLCNMLGYGDMSWGHITSCGSVANIESLWASRNLKFLPLALQKIVQTLPETPAELRVLLSPTWQLLNLPSKDILDLQDKVKSLCDQEKGGTVYEAQLAKYDLPHLGYTEFCSEHRLNSTGVYVVPASRHYSWDKAGALLGIGQSQMKTIPVDSNGRLDIQQLEHVLRKCAEKKIPVLQVVAVVGSTAEGAVDPLQKIIKLREDLREKIGLYFRVHADAAWGGYFCSMLQKDHADIVDFVPFLPLNQKITEELEMLRECDSITIDPHKSGFIQYPAGALCYRDIRTRFVTTFQAPYIAQAGDNNIGIFGIEGSKPGAAAAAAYLHQRIVPLDWRHHGRLLAEAHFTSKKIFAVLATMAAGDDPFQIALYNEDNLEEKLKVLKVITDLDNIEILRDPAYFGTLSEVGSDLLINSFTVNFKSRSGRLNTSLKKMNEFVDAIGTDLSITSTCFKTKTFGKTGVSRRPLFMVHNELDLESFKAPVERMLNTLNVKKEPGCTSMSCLSNANMDPWPTATGYLKTFEEDLRQSILFALGVNDKPTNIKFILYPGNHRYAELLSFEGGLLEIEVESDEEKEREKEKEERNEEPAGYQLIVNLHKGYESLFEVDNSKEDTQHSILVTKKPTTIHQLLSDPIVKDVVRRFRYDFKKPHDAGRYLLFGIHNSLKGTGFDIFLSKCCSRFDPDWQCFHVSHSGISDETLIKQGLLVDLVEGSPRPFAKKTITVAYTKKGGQPGTATITLGSWSYPNPIKK